MITVNIPNTIRSITTYNDVGKTTFDAGTLHQLIRVLIGREDRRQTSSVTHPGSPRLFCWLVQFHANPPRAMRYHLCSSCLHSKHHAPVNCPTPMCSAICPANDSYAMVNACRPGYQGTFLHASSSSVSSCSTTLFLPFPLRGPPFAMALFSFTGLGDELLESSSTVLVSTCRGSTQSLPPVLITR